MIIFAPFMEFYNTISQAGTAEFKDRGSKFLAYALPVVSVAEFKAQLQALKKEHAKAVHHCFAYRLGIDQNNFRSSDDGEPAGTAGKPILGQLDSKQLTDTAVIVVRYFGGTLLGVPGLIHAYKTSASLVLQVVPIVQKPIFISFDLEYDYTLMNDVMLVVKQLQCIIESQQAILFCTMRVGVPVAKKEEFLYRMKNIPNVTVR